MGVLCVRTCPVHCASSAVPTQEFAQRIWRRQVMPNQTAVSHMKGCERCVGHTARNMLSLPTIQTNNIARMCTCMALPARVVCRAKGMLHCIRYVLAAVMSTRSTRLALVAIASLWAEGPISQQWYPRARRRRSGEGAALGRISVSQRSADVTAS